MLKIKLARFGKRNQPHYRIVINEAKDKRDGSYVEMIGYYIPAQNPKVLELDQKKYEDWMTKGAQPTEIVAYLYKVAKAGKGFPKKKAKKSRKQVAKEIAAKEAVTKEKAEAKTEVKAETKAEVKAEAKTEVKAETKAVVADADQVETKQDKQVEEKPEEKKETAAA